MFTKQSLRHQYFILFLLNVRMYLKNLLRCNLIKYLSKLTRTSLEAVTIDVATMLSYYLAGVSGSSTVFNGCAV